MIINLLIRIAITAMSLWVAAGILPGIEIDGTWNFFIAAILLGVVNLLVRPIAVILTLPISVITLGVFLLIINAGMLSLVAYIMDDFAIAGFFSALFGSLIISLVSAWSLKTLGTNQNVELSFMKGGKFRR